MDVKLDELNLPDMTQGVHGNRMSKNILNRMREGRTKTSSSEDKTGEKVKARGRQGLRLVVYNESLVSC